MCTFDNVRCPQCQTSAFFPPPSAANASTIDRSAKLILRLPNGGAGQDGGESAEVPVQPSRKGKGMEEKRRRGGRATERQYSQVASDLT